MVAVMQRDEVDVALEAWVRWARRALAEIGWPQENIIARIVRYGARGAAQQGGMRVLEVDELCELVDRALLRLKEDEREVLVRQYWYHETLKVTADQCKMSHDKVRKLWITGRRRIADFLDGAKLRYA